MLTQKQRLGVAIFSTGLLIFSSLVAHADSATKTLNSMLEEFSQPAPISKTAIEDSKGQVTFTEQMRQNRCAVDELQVFEIENSVIENLKSAWLKRKPGVDESAKQFQISSSREEAANFNGLTRAKWKTDGSSTTLSAWLKDFNSLRDVDLEIVDYSAPAHIRNDQHRFSQVETTLRFDVRGIAKSGVKRQDRGMMRVLFERKSGSWQPAQLQVIEGETLLASNTHKPMFKEAQSEKGLGQLPVHLRTEAIRRGGYAMAMADINGDGINDMLVGGRDSTKLLLGTKSGRFEDRTKGSGLEHLTYVKTAIFADFRQSGQQDLALTLLLPGTQNARKGFASVLLFQGDGTGKFTQKPLGLKNKEAFRQPMAAAVADFNSDGWLDLYVGYPGMRDFTVFVDSPEKMASQGLYLNDGKGGFTDFTDAMKKADWARADKLFPHAAIALNIDQKTGVDLIVADDRNNLSPVYLNEGKAKFKELSNVIGMGNRGYGMGFAVGDYNNDGITDMAWTNVNFNATQRRSKACGRYWDLKSRFDEAGLRLFKGNGQGGFEEVTTPAGLLETAGRGAAGATFLDYNGDGLQDLYLTNGLWTGEKNGQELDTIFSEMAFYKKSPVMPHLLKNEDDIGFKELLRTFENRVVINDTKHSLQKAGKPSLAGNQRNRLFRNNGDGTFTDVAFFEGVDSIADGYIVGTVMNENGYPDLVLRNADPGVSDHQFPTVQYFKNTKKDKVNRQLLLSLEGTRSNRDAFGTYVIADFGDRKNVQHLIGNVGSFQNERLLQFNLLNQETIPTLTIHWDSGHVQTLKDVKPGRLHVVEDATKKMATAASGK